MSADVRFLRRLAVTVVAVALVSGSVMLGTASAASGPVFTKQPPPVWITNAGNTRIFEVIATTDAPGLTMDEQKSMNGGASWTTLSGCGGPSRLDCGMVLQNVSLSENGALYRMYATDSNGLSASSDVLHVVVCSGDSCADPTFAVSPASGVVSGQELTATAAHMLPNMPVSIATCATDDTFCPSNASETAMTDSGGQLSMTFVAHRLTGRLRDCLHLTNGCEAVASMDGVRVGHVRLSYLPVQPDGRQRRSSDGTIFFDNVYSPFVDNQHVQHAIAAGGRWSYAFQVQNDGPIADDITVSGPASPPNYFRVRYFVGFYDVTDIVSNGGFTHRNMAPGEVRNMSVQFTALPGTAVGYRMTATMRSTSVTDREARDTVNLEVIVK